MKVNINSWHYNVMCYFKWSRKSFGDWKYHDYSSFDRWYLDNYTSEDYKSFGVFKRFMSETGEFQPTDFCTYWRNVLLWPLIFALLWMLPLSAAVYTFVTAPWTGLVFSTAVCGGSLIAVVAFIFGFIGVIEWLENRNGKRKKPKEPGFLSKVGESLRHPEFCTIMEYEKDGE